MNTFNSPSRTPITARISSERDVVAASLFLLGYWPENSLVILASDGQGVGPILRVDLPILTENRVEEAVNALLTYLPAETSSGTPTQQIFVLAFTESKAERNTNQSQESKLKEKELVAFSQTSVLPELHLQTTLRDITLQDLIIIGHDDIWALDRTKLNLHQVCQVEDITCSGVYIDFLTRGYSIAENIEQSAEQLSPAPLHTHDAEECDHWLSLAEILTAESTTQRHTLNPPTTFQLEADLTIWDRVLTTITQDIHTECGTAQTHQEAQNLRRKLLTTGQGYILGDKLRELVSPHIAAHLASSLDNSLTMQLLLGATLETLEAAHQALELIAEIEGTQPEGPHQEHHRLLPPQEELTPLGCTELHQKTHLPHPKTPATSDAARPLATALLGAQDKQPHWTKLIALESLAALLENITTTQAESHFIALQAWIRWSFGYSSEAAILLNKANRLSPSTTPLPIHTLITSGVLPLWITPDPTTPRK